MKKLTTLMLGLSLVLGTAAFAQDQPADKPAAEKKVKKTKKAKKVKKEAAKPADATK